jgi:hypothetical protein
MPDVKKIIKVSVDLFLPVMLDPEIDTTNLDFNILPCPDATCAFELYPKTKRLVRLPCAVVYSDEDVRWEVKSTEEIEA